MAFIRACSYVCIIIPPEAPGAYSEVLVTFQQDKMNVINKSLSDMTIDDGGFIVKLTQAETAKFSSPGCIKMQARCYASEYNVQGSEEWKIPVLPALNDTILGGT